MKLPKENSLKPTPEPGDVLINGKIYKNWDDVNIESSQQISAH